jgi:hypothetical protein
MMETWVVYLLIGLVCFAAGWYVHSWRVRKPPVTSDKRVTRLRAIMDEYEVYQDVHLHRNRIGSIAVALGQAPEVWPEDMRQPDDQD